VKLHLVERLSVVDAFVDQRVPRSNSTALIAIIVALSASPRAQGWPYARSMAGADLRRHPAHYGR